MKINYVFKYDKKNFLYKYVEKNSGGKVINYYSFNHRKNTLTKYNSKDKLKYLVEFYEPCKLVHRFEAGESWVKIVPDNCDSTSMFLPKIKKNFAINQDNQIVSYSVSGKILKNWNSIG